MRSSPVIRSSPLIEAVSGQGVDRTRELASRSRSLGTVGWAGPERVLLVEPDKVRRAHLRDTVRDIAEIDGDVDFATARRHLFSKPYQWLVTNIRLGAYNGLHLVHLAKASRLPIRALVYADGHDLWLAQEAQRAGAFYESRERVDRALPAYLRAALPLQDRRSPAEADRRTAPRGGRRCTDSARGSDPVAQGAP